MSRSSNLYQRGNIWWIRYSVDGKQQRESSKSERRKDAQALLQKRMAEIGQGMFVGPSGEKLMVGTFTKRNEPEARTLVAMAMSHYRGTKSEERAERALRKHICRHFGNYRVKNVRLDGLMQYVDDRRAEGAEDATIQYELAVLRKALSLAVDAGYLAQRPKFPTLAIANARAGFFERVDFVKLRDELPDSLRELAVVMYWTGWRSKSELLPMTWAQLDMDVGIMRLEPGTTKNKEAREFPFGQLPELKAALEAQRRYTDKIERRTGAVIPWVFHREGVPIRDFRGAWLSASVRAGLAIQATDSEGNPKVDRKGDPVLKATKIPHDFRRTAVRNLTRAGVDRGVAMKLVGHRTESVFRRYSIIVDRDLEEGVRKLAGLGDADKDNVLRFPQQTGT